MLFIEDNLKEIIQEVVELARQKFGSRINQAKKDIREFLKITEEDLNRWWSLLYTRDIPEQDFIVLVKNRKDRMELIALTQAGLSLAALEAFKDEVLNILIRIGMRFLKETEMHAAADQDNPINDIYMLSIYLSSWEEDKRNEPGEKITRCWKGYRYEILDELESKGLIYKVPGGKSIIVKDRGWQRGMELTRKFRVIIPELKQLEAQPPGSIKNKN